MKNPTDAVLLLFVCCLPLLAGVGGCANPHHRTSHEKRHESVIKDVSVKLVANPNDPELLVARGTAYWCAGQLGRTLSDMKQAYERSLSDFNRAIGIDPENREAYRGRAKANFLLDKTEEGRADQKRYIALAPEEYVRDESSKGLGYVSRDNDTFILPVTGFCFADRELILGSTTAAQAQEMLPPETASERISPVVGKITKPRIGKVAGVIDNVRLRYRPNAFPFAFLIFDKNDKLVVVYLVQSMQFDIKDPIHPFDLQIGPKKLEKVEELMRKYQFTEIYRDGWQKTMRADITPCVTVDIKMPTTPEPDPSYVSYVLEYIYTCDTD